MTAKRILRTVSALLALVIFAMAVVPVSPALAVSQSEIDALEEQRDELKAEREDMQAEIDALKDEQAGVLEQKRALDEQNEVYRQELELIEEQVELYTRLVDEKAAELEKAMAAEEEQLATYRQHVRAMEENGKYTYLSIIFGSKSLSELMSNLDMIGEIMEADKRIYDQYTEARERAEEIKAEYEATLEQLGEKQEEYEAEKAELEAKIAEASALIEQLEEEINSNYELYLEVLAQEEALESDIQNKIAELERQEAANSITSTGTYIWPLPGYSPGSAYGWRMHPIYHEMRFHAGEDIGAPTGTPILAADSGVAAVYPDNGNGYGNYIMINHGGGRVTLYAHMSAFAISNGASVTQGQVIGYVGSTGNSTGPHLHFEVRVNGATTDPKQYFNFG
ncbi:MAG TPA: peptidoglycan DD-metalloendopeptidase family protein [Candidatus Scatomorpha pullistercoris]|uniref:Peptidoglycan DD-metalloendopeptidase family protein n=1 Tax=Candidatus Scatomorpha pullistercoris TaxID=2840929 RepID=A0A9D1G449_9FIRM|nr:peptidoglycan DD-metalloendopeptidase family protein [Candidatus Scatomorpha pullistercoris]